jgi:hypothetical protein
MLSRVLQLPTDLPPERALAEFAAEAAPAEPPDLVLAFLPPGEALAGTLAALAGRWPSAPVAGCEAVTQFAGGALATGGSIQLLRFERPGHGAEVVALAGSFAQPPEPAAVDDLAVRSAAADAVLLRVDGLRFPVQATLARLRRRLAGTAPPPIAGGLASQPEPVEAPGARVFSGTRVYESACLAVLLRGVEAQAEVVRGWDPASPVSRVTRAEGNVLWEIDGEPATAWYRRFFDVGGRLAPMPESAYRFPLIVEGPAPERRGLYRSMRFFDQPAGAVTFWGDLVTGDRVRLGMGNDQSLVRTAEELPPARRRPEAAVLFSCVGRELVLGEQAPAETAAIHRVLGGVALAGFFSFAEIGPSEGGPAFYNQTAILVTLQEAAG